MYHAVITYTYIHNAYIVSKYVCNNYKHEQTIAVLNTKSL